MYVCVWLGKYVRLTFSVGEGLCQSHYQVTTPPVVKLYLCSRGIVQLVRELCLLRSASLSPTNSPGNYCKQARGNTGF